MCKIAQSLLIFLAFSLCGCMNVTREVVTDDGEVKLFRERYGVDITWICAQRKYGDDSLVFELSPEAPERLIGVEISGLVSAQEHYGLALSLTRECQTFHGAQLDLGGQIGVLNGVYGSLSFNFVNERLRGIQFAPIAAISRGYKASNYGVQLSIYSDAEQFHGIQCGIATKRGSGNGLNLGLFNWIAEDAYSIQIGLYNKQYHGLGWGIPNYEPVKGVQLGLINIANRFKGVQLGLLNFIEGYRFPFPLIYIGW